MRPGLSASDPGSGTGARSRPGGEIAGAPDPGGGSAGSRPGGGSAGGPGVPLRDRLRRLVPGLPRLFPPGRVAILRLHGPILGAGRTADWVELVRHLRESRRVPAVVLDVDSPGGATTASDDVYLALERLAGAKPLVAAIRGTGASGAYLAALAAHRIVAAPTAIVGSIGVIAVSPRLPRLLERLGVSVSENRAGRLKGMGAPWRDETPEEREKEQALAWLEKAYEDRSGWLALWLKVDPKFDGLRADERFRDLLRRVGLAP